MQGLRTSGCRASQPSPSQNSACAAAAPSRAAASSAASAARMLFAVGFGTWAAKSGGAGPAALRGLSKRCSPPCAGPRLPKPHTHAQKQPLRGDLPRPGARAQAARFPRGLLTLRLFDAGAAICRFQRGISVVLQRRMGAERCSSMDGHSTSRSMRRHMAAPEKSLPGRCLPDSPLCAAHSCISNTRYACVAINEESGVALPGCRQKGGQTWTCR